MTGPDTRRGLAKVRERTNVDTKVKGSAERHGGKRRAEKVNAWVGLGI